jgi:hypothetical protein
LKEVKWARGLLEEIGLKQIRPTIIFQDNQSTIRLCEKEGSENLSKHVMPLLAVIRQAITMGIMRLEYCPTKWMIADILTSVQTRGEYYVYARTCLTEGLSAMVRELCRNGKGDEFLLDKALPGWLRDKVKSLL